MFFLPNAPLKILCHRLFVVFFCLLCVCKQTIQSNCTHCWNPLPGMGFGQHVSFGSFQQSLEISNPFCLSLSTPSIAAIETHTWKKHAHNRLADCKGPSSKVFPSWQCFAMILLVVVVLAGVKQRSSQAKKQPRETKRSMQWFRNQLQPSDVHFNDHGCNYITPMQHLRL